MRILSEFIYFRFKIAMLFDNDVLIYSLKIKYYSNSLYII